MMHGYCSLMIYESGQTHKNFAGEIFLWLLRYQHDAI